MVPFALTTASGGIAFGGARGRTDAPTIVMPLEDTNKAFDLMHAGESIRSVVVF